MIVDQMMILNWLRKHGKTVGTAEVIKKFKITMSKASEKLRSLLKYDLIKSTLVRERGGWRRRWWA